MRESNNLKLSNPASPAGRSKTLPVHVAFIVDGNRRWAKQRGLPEVMGHRQVVDKTLDEIVSHAVAKGISFVTFWVFSTDNWKRGEKFANLLFSLVERYLRQKASFYHSQGYRLKIIGDTAKLPKHLEKMLLDWQEKTRENKKITITIAINYGGRDEILRAINKIVIPTESDLSDERRNLRKSGFLPKDPSISLGMTEEKFEKLLDTTDIPDPDMIVRTGGEKRLSGFLMWQAEYAELYFTDTLMPDFTPEEFDKALGWYAGRERRFGK